MNVETNSECNTYNNKLKFYDYKEKYFNELKKVFWYCAL